MDFTVVLPSKKYNYDVLEMFELSTKKKVNTSGRWYGIVGWDDREVLTGKHEIDERKANIRTWARLG